jgi:2,5-dioxopentanoate dehydrogenase
MPPTGNTTITRSVDPRTGEAFGPAHEDATPAQVAAAVDAATAAFAVTSRAAPETIAGLLEAIADGLEALGDRLVDTAVAETGLDTARITGERGRTCGQLRAFAEVARTGSHLDIRIDPADPTRTPPRPDLRRMQIPLGPVAVWGASNFPLAFSVPGGDTASALAAGCPVIAKAHPSHPATSELCAQVIITAVAEAGLPPGTFALLHGRDPSVSRALVTAPGIAAVGFTGSQAAGRSLYDLAAARPEPIPVFAEMGSLNPQFVTEAAIAAGVDDLAAGLVGSVTLGAGQFCTKPGLVFLPDSPAGRDLEAAMVAAAAQVRPAPLLADGIGSGFRHRLAELSELPDVEVVVADEAADAGTWAGPSLLVTHAGAFAATPLLREECFGPATILVRVAALDDMVTIAAGLPGSLTASVHAVEDEVDRVADLVATLQHRVGRVLWNQFPTGVAVTHAMHHAGPYPASTFVQHTSVGTAAIARFIRPVVYQNTPQALLPEPLRDANPSRRWRLVDGHLTREAIG